uniref:Uncharacterized protein n=1 Tax=Avena sativa TaxID=4498 RepID=A0ACD5W019_AVESA
MASTTATNTTSCGHALLKGLGSKLHACTSRLRDHRPIFPASGTASSVLLLALAVLVCGSTALSRVVVFFLPLVISTSICCAAVYLLVTSEGGSAKEVVLLCGDRAEVGLMEVYGDANASAYGDGRDVQAGCFLHRRPHGVGGVGGGWTKSGVDEDGNEVVFAGRVAVGGGVQEGAAPLEEELLALQVDRLAEGVWDRYFGGSSRWNYVTDDGSQEIEQQRT